MKVKAAIFDIGATLITGPPIAPNKIIAKLFPNADPQEVSDFVLSANFESPSHACMLIMERFGQLSAAAQDEIHHLWQSQLTAPVAIDGASQTAIKIAQRGVRIGLLSDIWTPYWEGTRKAIPDIINISEATVLSFRTGKRKPDKYNFIKILSDMHVDAYEAAMIGDTYTHDMQPAIELGMKTIWVLARPEREADAISKVKCGIFPKPDYIVDNIKQVAEIDLLHGNISGE